MHQFGSEPSLTLVGGFSFLIYEDTMTMLSLAHVTVVFIFTPPPKQKQQQKKQKTLPFCPNAHKYGSAGASLFYNALRTPRNLQVEGVNTCITLKSWILALN